MTLVQLVTIIRNQPSSIIVCIANGMILDNMAT